MNYSIHPSSCRVDFFKPSGKWKGTEEVDFSVLSHEEYEDHWPADAFRKVLAMTLNGRYAGMTAVCIQPYLKHNYPLMVKLPE